MISIYNIEINEKDTIFPSRGVSKKYKFTGCLILSYKFIPSTAIKLDGEIWLYECLKYTISNRKQCYIKDFQYMGFV